MEILERLPFKSRKAVFERLEQLASKANMTMEERQQYEEEWKMYNDYYNTLDYAKKEGILSVAQNLKKMGMSIEQIQQATGLTAEEIEKIE